MTFVAFVSPGRELGTCAYSGQEEMSNVPSRILGIENAHLCEIPFWGLLLGLQFLLS